jgi:hypothetical protein
VGPDRAWLTGSADSRSGIGARRNPTHICSGRRVLERIVVQIIQPWLGGQRSISRQGMGTSIQANSPLTKINDEGPFLQLSGHAGAWNWLRLEPNADGDGAGSLLWVLIGRHLRSQFPARAARTSHTVFIMQMLCGVARCGFGLSGASIRFDEASGAKAACCGARDSNSGFKSGYSKIPNINRYLERNFDHDHVLFVQHPLEKGRSWGVRGGSIVACANVFSNCDQATEGASRSRPVRWFAEVPRADAGVSEGAKRLSGFPGD